MPRHYDDSLVDEFDLEYWFDREGLAHKVGRGSSGMQINAQTCPACGDRRWRTYLNAESGLGNCFVCNETFSKAKFVHLTLGHEMDDRRQWAETFKHMREVAAEAGWKPRRSTPVAVEFGEAKLPTSFELPTPEGQNLKYLEDRGFNGRLARMFHLRYCEHGYHSFAREDGSTGRQFFDGRVIIPVFDLDGSLKTFQGRDITGLATDQKYLFPTGLPGTGRYLLNGHTVQKAKRIALGEGVFDVMAMTKAFEADQALRDVVSLGTFGKHLSYGQPDGNDQLGRLCALRKQGVEEVTIMWDGEWKALKAALDAAQLIQGVGLRARIAILPAGRDPNEIPPAVCRQAFMDARPFSMALAVQWRLRNPYS